MNYKNYKIEDFLLDEAFVRWVKTQENHAFWQAFFAENPAQKEVAEQAKTMILSVNVDKGQKERLKKRIYDSIDIAEASKQAKVRHIHKAYQVLAVAATISLLLVGGYFYFANQPDTQSGKWVYQNLMEKTETSLIEVLNENETPRLIILGDSSSVLLRKGSRLSYSKDFGQSNKRIVYLLGEAFFEVTKNPSKPFLVYSNELITRVLGTSFNVKAYPNDKNVVVTVKTGKVTVFSNKEVLESQKADNKHNRSTEGVVLIPNQQIVFNRAEAQILKELVQTPSLQELSNIQKLSFDFNDTPIAEVFTLLEKAYSVNIIYDEKLLKECKLTAKMNDEPLFEKLKLICWAIESEYQIIDAQIVIHSKGCQ